MKILKLYDENGYKYYLLDGGNRYEITKAEYIPQEFKIMIEYKDNNGLLQYAFIDRE